MGLADRLKETSDVHHNAGCAVGDLLQRLPDTDVEALQAALDDPTVMHATIARALQAEGYRPTKHTVGRHRRRECKCDEAGLV